MIFCCTSSSHWAMINANFITSIHMILYQHTKFKLLYHELPWNLKFEIFCCMLEIVFGMYIVLRWRMRLGVWNFLLHFWGCLCSVFRWRRKFSSATSWFTNLEKVWSTWAHQEQNQTTRILCRQWSLGERWNLFRITLSSFTCSYLIFEMLFSSCLICCK